MTSHTDSHIQASRRRMFLGAATLIMSSALALACGNKSDHATDGDTGAAAPATVQDMSATPRAGDSTTGVSNATGQPQNAGDTLGSRGRDSTAPSVAGAANTTTKKP